MSAAGGAELHGFDEVFAKELNKVCIPRGWSPGSGNYATKRAYMLVLMNISLAGSKTNRFGSQVSLGEVLSKQIRDKEL